MIKKEFLSLIKPTLQRFGLLMLLPFAFLLDAAGVIPTLTFRALSLLLFAIYLSIVIWLAASFGLDVYREEHVDDAFEYLFTFPIGRFALINAKLWPRIAIISLFTFFLSLFWIFLSQYRFIGLEGAWFVVLCILFLNLLFMFGYFISYVFSKSLRLGLFCLTLATYALLIILGERMLDFSDGPNKYLLFLNITAVLVLVILAAVSRSVLETFDLRTVGQYSKRFTLRILLVFLPLDVLGLVLILS
jgi:hypothetical protein